MAHTPIGPDTEAMLFYEGFDAGKYNQIQRAGVVQWQNSPFPGFGHQLILPTLFHLFQLKSSDSCNV